MRVLFHENQLSFRGTSTALFDYAYFNQKILGNESIIIYQENNPNNFKPAIEYFSKNFNVYKYKNNDELKRIIKQTQTDIFYKIVAGNKEDISFIDVKTAIHVVFQYYQPYGDTYAYVSKWLSDKMTNGVAPYVPHMINLPYVDEDLRDELKIPKDAIVFGRYGGYETFDIKFVHEVIKKLSRKRKDIFFLFMATKPFAKNNFFHKYDNIIFLPATVDPAYKVKFINTCNALLHARKQGESFGISVGEFSIKNKPVITWDGSFERNHLDLLGDAALTYSDANELYSILTNFSSNESLKKNWDCFSKDFSPQPVMDKFNKVFLT